MAVVVVVPLLVLLVCFVSLGYAALAPELSKATTSWLRDLVRVSSFVIGPVAIAALRLTKWVTHRLGQVFLDAERLAVAWINGVAIWAETVIVFALTWPIELFRVTWWLLYTKIPQLVRALPNSATQVVKVVRTQVVRVERQTVKVVRLSHVLPRKYVTAAIATLVAPYLMPLRWLRLHFHALTAVLPHTLPIPFGRTIAQIRRRLRSLERLRPGSLAFAGAVAFALSRLGLGWLRCNSVRNIGRKLGCGGFGLLEELLFGAFDALLLADLCELVDGMTKAAELFEPALAELIGVEESLIGCHGITGPPTMPRRTLYLPPEPIVAGF